MASDSGLRLETDGPAGTDSSRSTGRSASDEFRPLTGARKGVEAYVKVYLATTALYLYTLWSDGTSPMEFLEAGNNVDFFGLVFYNAHRIDAVPAGAGMGSASETFNNILAMEQPIELLFYLIPLAILFDAGYRVASNAEDSLTGLHAAVAGASVVVGYFPLFVAGAFFFTYPGSVGTLSPQLDAQLLLVGAAYAAVCGGLGGPSAALIDR